VTGGGPAVGAPDGPAGAGPTVEAVGARLALIRQRIEAAAAGRPVEVVAVTKAMGTVAVDVAVAVGLTSVGENYAQELVAKAAAGAGGTAVRWHFLGGVQRNKVRHLAPLVELWQSVDRPEVIEAIAARASGARVLVQVDLAGLAGRSGCRPADVAALVATARQAGLVVRGLMAVGPPGPAEAARPAFRSLARLADGLGLPEVSMGMSGDFVVAVEEGATMVRLGTALFGPRSAPGGTGR